MKADEVFTPEFDPRAVDAVLGAVCAGINAENGMNSREAGYEWIDGDSVALNLVSYGGCETEDLWSIIRWAFYGIKGSLESAFGCEVGMQENAFSESGDELDDIYCRAVATVQCHIYPMKRD